MQAKTKLMVASSQHGYRAALTDANNNIIQTSPTAHLSILKAQRDAGEWARRACLWFDDSITLPNDIVTHTRLQVGQQRSVRAYLGA